MVVKTPLSKRKPWPTSGAVSPSSPAPPIIICIPPGAMASASGWCGGALCAETPPTGAMSMADNESAETRWASTTTNIRVLCQSHADLPSDRTKPIARPRP